MVDKLKILAFCLVTGALLYIMLPVLTIMAYQIFEWGFRLW